jgi:hypothetical protein
VKKYWRITMAKAKNPITFSNYYGISNEKLDELGIFDPTISIDTKLFIDPLLLAFSSHSEINAFAVQVYRERFENVIKFLSLSNKTEDIGWRTAKRLLEFHEIKGTCLGYGAGSISGSGFGPKLTDHILCVAKEIVDLGVRDPDLFPLMAIFEANIGPDRISDMVTNVISPALISFNKRILSGISLKGEKYTVNGIDGLFVPNPYEDDTPIILLPNDILRKLPVAKDWDQVADVAAKNQRLRDKVNLYIAHIWAKKTKREKSKLKKQAMSSKAAFDTLLEIIHSVPPIPYDISNDPDGLISWARLSQKMVLRYPLKIGGVKTVLNLESAYEIVKIIISQFKQLVEKNGLNKELYKKDGAPRHESSSQRLFFAIAYSYCKANDLDISPEVDTGTGKIDFKFSTGFESRILVEVKLSANPNVVKGYISQLEVYKQSEETMKAFYLVIDVGGMGQKDEKLYVLRNRASSEGYPLSDIEFVDAKIKPSASKRK